MHGIMLKWGIYFSSKRIEIFKLRWGNATTIQVPQVFVFVDCSKPVYGLL